MSEINARNTEELAYLLWERQGRPQNRSVENWLEAEYLEHSLGISHVRTKAENEVELRMRGLGPLTRIEGPVANGMAKQGRGAAVSRRENSRQGRSVFRPVIASCVMGTGLIIAIGIAFSFFRKHVY